jgi:hypothetical protein
MPKTKAERKRAQQRKKSDKVAAARLQVAAAERQEKLTTSNSQNGGQSTENIKNKQIELVKATLRDAKSMAEAIFSQLGDGVKAKLSGKFSGLSDEDKDAIIKHYESNFQAAVKIVTLELQNKVHEAIFAELVKMNEAEKLFNEMVKAHKGADNKGADKGAASTVDITNGIAKRLTEQVQSGRSKHPARRKSLSYLAVAPAQSEQTPSQPSARSWSKGQKGVAACLLGVGLGAMGTVAAHSFGVMNMAPVFGAVAMAFANPATLPFAVVGAALVAGLLAVAGIYLTKDQSSQTEIAA